MQWRDKLFLFQKVDEKCGGAIMINENTQKLKENLKRDYYSELKECHEFIQDSLK